MATRKHGLYRRLDHPAQDAAKAACYLTGSSGPCVDTGVLIEFEGTLTISLSALKELAEVAGFSVNEEGEQQEAEIEWLHKTVTDLEAKITDLEEQLEAVGQAITRAQTAKAKA